MAANVSGWDTAKSTHGYEVLACAVRKLRIRMTGDQESRGAATG